MIRASRGTWLLLACSDLLLVAGAFSAAYVLRFRYGLLELTEVASAPGFETYAEAMGVFGLVFLVVFGARGLYGQLHPRGFDVLEKTLASLNIAMLVVLALGFFYRGFSYSRSASLIAWGLLTLSLPAPRLLLLQARRRRFRRGAGLIRAAVLGVGDRALELHERLVKLRRYGLEARGLVRGPGDDEAGVEGSEAPVLGSLADLDALVQEHGLRELLVPDALPRLELLDVLEQCGRAGLRVRVVPRIFDLFITEGDLTELYGVPFVSVREEREERLSLALKRTFDLLVGLPLLLLISPFIALLAIMVRRDSPGPALFVQTRIGRDGVPFDMWKLRSMVVDAPERLADLVDLSALDQPVYKFEDDPRVTRVGRLLRRWSLDELPQLWNVIRGEMSLVGPRPEVAEVVDHYDSHQRRRLKAKPGLTGLQQVEARGSTDLDERIRLDVYYLRRRSFLFDLWILARTPWAVLSGRGAH